MRTSRLITLPATLLTLGFVLTASLASAQTGVGPWEPAMTVGIGTGVFGDGDGRHNDNNRFLSGTFEMPLSTATRVRIETGRMSLPIVEDAAATLGRADTASLRRLTISLAGLRHPGAGATTYFGVGLGLYQVTLGADTKPVYRHGLYYHGGIEFELSDQITVDTEVGMHLMRFQTLYPGASFPCEALVRLKLHM